MAHRAAAPSIIDIITGQMVFYREKVDTLFHGSRKSSESAAGRSTRAIQKRIRVLGQRVGVEQISPHDLRHYWATTATRAGTHPFALQEAGGWASLTTPRWYTEAPKVVNEGVKLEL